MANLPPVTIASWLATSTDILRRAEIASARLDTEIILAHTLKKPRTWLHMYRDEPLDARMQEIADARIDLRSDHTPIAYIIGHKEFYGRLFTVNSNVLVPSPESEAIIELALSVDLPSDATIVDVGTGSGTLGLTLALERPEITTMTLTDVSEPVLRVARKNAAALGLPDVEFIRSNLLEFALPAAAPRFDMIVANLPYVDREWQLGSELRHEPALALFAENHGLKLINRLIDQASRTLKPQGYLLLEADPRQHDAIMKTAENAGFSAVKTLGYALLFAK